MKKTTFWACVFVLMIALFAITSNLVAQDITTNYGCSAIASDSVANSYSVKLVGITQKKAVDLCVDQIKAKCKNPQQVSCYIVQYYEKMYQIDLDERVTGREGFPKKFTNIAEVRDFIKKDLKFALDNL